MRPLLYGVMLAPIVAACFDPCGNTLTQTVPAPSGTHTALVFFRGCGAMTSRAGNGVSLFRGSNAKLPDGNAGNVYLNDNWGPGETRVPTAIDVNWESDSVLVIRHDPRAHIVFAAIKFDNVVVRYDTLR